MMSQHVVLVVDDDPDIRETIVEVLEDHGYKAIGAANGATALATLRAQSITPCLILLDMMMPVMDGETFRHEQLKVPEWADIPVVLMSAYQNVAAKAAALALEHIAKPLGVSTLVDTTRRYCDAST